MELLKNWISPKSTRKKLPLAGGDSPATSSHRVFGVRLEELVARSSCSLPPVLCRICEYIYRHGLDSVGLFRVSGSVRVIERMRAQFELTGDVNLEEENDVAAAAGLLKVFLRDLPDTLVPARMTRRFFSVVQDGQLTGDGLLVELRRLLALLPHENLSVLKYISSLLAVVADNQALNRMSATSLATLFGPNVFRYELTSDVEGLRDMESSKDLMHLFITQYDKLFADEGDLSPAEFWRCSCKKTPPPRPPPPKVHSLPSLDSFHGLEVSAHLASSSSTTDIFSLHSNVHSSDKLSLDLNTSQRLVAALPSFSPLDEVDHSRAQSPFIVDSETHSTVHSPLVTARTHEFVEKTIVDTISQHIFGAIDFNQNSGPQSPISPKPDEVVEFGLVHNTGSSVDAPVVQAVDATSSGTHAGASCKQTCGNSGPVETLSGTSSAPKSPVDLPDLDSVVRSQLLSGHKRPAGPSRRLPSREHRLSFEVTPVAGPQVSQASQSETDIRHQNLSLNNLQEAGDKENLAHHPFLYSPVKQGSSPPPLRPWNLSRNESKALSVQSASVLNTPEAGLAPQSSGSSSNDRSPGSSFKLFIPPLDLSTLHQHVDGVDPIPVSVERSDSQIWIKTKDLAGCDDDVAIISPRSHKLKKRNEASLNTDIPPSPPVQQDLYQKVSDDDCSHRLRQMTKKIQGLKKKIKNFEESFEKDHGYRPSHGEKSAQPDIKKYLTELARVRKDLKVLKEETEKGNRSRHNSGASSSGVELSPPVKPTVSTTLELILKCLTDKRHDGGRPEEVMLMSRDQVQEEKLAVQRALLHFEGIHGRPMSREDKDLMRPLYDRYRSVKRILAKPMSPRNSLELQTVPEDCIIELPRSFTREPIRVPTAESEENSGEQTLYPDMTLEQTACPSLDLISSQDKGLQQAGGGGQTPDSDEARRDVRLHEMSLSELHLEVEMSRRDKKQLRRTLRQFEQDFFHNNGRKVHKEDRYPLHSEYSQYKKLKARLRLLEALILKQHE